LSTPGKIFRPGWPKICFLFIQFRWVIDHSSHSFHFSGIANTLTGPTVRSVTELVDPSKRCLQNEQLQEPLQNLLQGPRRISHHNYHQSSNNSPFHKPSHNFNHNTSQNKPNNIPVIKPMKNLKRSLSSNADQEPIQNANQTFSVHSSTNVHRHTAATQPISMMTCCSAEHDWRQNSCSGLPLVKNGGTVMRGSGEMSLLLSPLASEDGGFSGRSCRSVHWYGGGGSLDYLDDLSAQQQHMNTYVYSIKYKTQVE
jgi:hypothetical protein